MILKLLEKAKTIENFSNLEDSPSNIGNNIAMARGIIDNSKLELTFGNIDLVQIVVVYAK